MKLPAPSEALFGHANWVEERMMQQDCPVRGTAEYLRRLAALGEVLEKGPGIVCLIGSTRFHKDFADQNYRFTLEGKIVLSIGYDLADDKKLGLTTQPEVKHGLDVLHLWKILLADEVFCINRDQYVGFSTARELGFATLMGRPISYLEHPLGEVFMNYEMPPEMAEIMALAAAAGLEGRQRMKGAPHGYGR